MKTPEFLKRKFAIGLSKSKYKETYSEIAKRYGYAPKYVYKLAHGKRPRKSKDHNILSELSFKGILFKKNEA